MIFWYTCVLLSNDTTVGICTVNTLGYANIIYICINERTDMGFLIIANNVRFLELEGRYY